MTLYDEIARNRRKTIVLMAVFTAVIVAIGWVFGQSQKDATLGILFAVLLATAMNLIGYFAGDSVTLAVSGAKKIAKSDHPELHRLVENLSITAGLPTPNIYLIDDPSPNAFATGRNPQHASVAVTTGLLNTLNKMELEGVVAHEMSHVKNLDIRVMTMTVILVGVIVLLSDWLLRSFLFHGSRNRDERSQLTIVLALVGIVLAILSPIIAELIKLAVSRSREYLADASGALLTRHPEGLASALEKIARTGEPLRRANHATAHLFIANPFGPTNHGRFSALFSTHPPIEVRIAKLRAMAT